MVQLEISDSIAILKMEIGQVNVDLLKALDQRLDEVEPTAAAVILTGTGPLFAIGDVATIVKGGAPYVREFLPLLSSFLRRFYTRPLPIVAALNGSAVGPGCYMAAACDRRVMNKDRAQIGTAEQLPFPVSGVEIMRSLLAGNGLNDLSYGRGRLLSGSEAVEIGLVDELVAAGDVLSRATEIAGRLARIPKDTFALTRMEIRQPAFEYMDRYGMWDRKVVEIWSRPSSLAFLRKVAERLAAQRQAAAGRS